MIRNSVLAYLGVILNSSLLLSYSRVVECAKSYEPDEEEQHNLIRH